MAIVVSKIALGLFYLKRNQNLDYLKYYWEFNEIGIYLKIYIYIQIDSRYKHMKSYSENVKNCRI